MSDWDPWNSNGDQDTSTDPSDDGQNAADYIRAADLHNLGNVGSSWFDFNPLNLPKFAAVSITSGLNSIYNTAIRIGNFFGADAEESKTEDAINNIFGGLDDNLAQYYQQNKGAADLAGFLVTSLVPGIGGIKILNAGQRALAAANDGIVGTNLGLALGLRSSQIDRYITQAGTEIATGQAAFTSITSSATKALSLGVYQNVLEGAAFETAVQATMQASPILDGQDARDIAWNIGTAGLFGGVLGGAFHAAQTVGSIKRTATAVSSLIDRFGQRDVLSFIDTKVPSDRLIGLADDLDHGPTLDPGDPNYAMEVQKLEARQTRIRNDMRSAVADIVPGSDNDLVRAVADSNQGQSADDIMSTFIDTDQIGRIGTPTRVETEIKENAKTGTPSNPNLQVAYAKLTGEDAGVVQDQAPVVTNLADRIVGTGGNSVRNAILNDVRNQGFKISDYWDAAKESLDTSGHLNAERRQIWASTILSQVPEEAQVGFRDLPVLERALSDGNRSIRLVGPTGKVLQDGFASLKELQDYIIAAKEDSAAQLGKKAIKLGRLGGEEDPKYAVTQKIAKITNTSLGKLEGTNVGDPGKDYFAWQQLQNQRNQFLADRDLTHPKDVENDPRFLPTWAKITKKIRNKTDVDGNVIDGLTYIKEQKKLTQQLVDNVVAKQAPSLINQLPDIADSYLARTNSLGTGSGRFTINNPSYDSLGSLVSFIGSKLSDYARDAKDAFAGSSQGALFNLAKKQDAVIEWSSLLQRVSRSADQWVKTFDDQGNHVLVEAKQFAKIGEDFGFDDLDPESVIHINNKEVGDLADLHSQQEAYLYGRRNERASALGADQARNLSITNDAGNSANIFRPIRAEPKDYPFFAFVKDPRVTGQGHTSMIFGQSAKELEDKAAIIRRTNPEMDIWFKRDTEEYQKAEQEYKYDRTLSENYLDSNLKNEGIYSDYFAKTDPQRVVDDFSQHHAKLLDIDARELIRSKYSAQFDWLEDQAHAFSRTATSRFGGNFTKLEAESSNPYLSYIKTALNLSRVQEAPLWYNINRWTDNAVSAAVGKIQDIWGAQKEVSPETLEQINGSLQKYGMNTGYYDAATNLLVNHQAPKAVLTKFVRGANAILAKLTLGLDPLNGLVNALGANILRSTELRQLVDAVSNGDSDIAGKLAGLSKIDITGKGDLIYSPVKLMATAMKDFLNKELPQHDLYKSLGLQKGYAQQFRSMIGDDLALQGNESVSVLQSKIRDAIAKANVLSEAGQKYTGNKLAEEFNRFVSARSIELLTNPAVDKGLISRQEQYAYMNTFVNRVEGNLVAAQRPFAFQGPIGQAIGLFQSYQLNIMQQLFRYVAEGNTKDAAMLLGLQGTFFGIQGLPAFQAINQHLIGTASGNPKHVDAYDAIYGIAGKNLGDILTYGLPSKLLSTNLYSRGDINPRQLTVLPTALDEVPIVGAYTKLFGSLKDTISKIAGGANVWETFLQGVEHNGISRPASGLAQTLQSTTGNGTPFSTTSKGDIQFSNDLFSFASLSRLAGGRPLDEAIVNDGVFRVHAYQQYDLARMQMLAEEIKNSSIQGQQMDLGQWQRFSAQYQANGGKQQMFNKYMMREIKAANTSDAQMITAQLNSPYAQKMQELMGDGAANVVTH